MKSFDVEKSALFGLLALQLGFVDRSAFLDFAAEWADNKSRSLRDLLVEKNALDSGQQKTVDAVVETFVAQFEGDAKRALVSIGSANSLREELAALDGANIDATMSFVATQSDTGKTTSSDGITSDGFTVSEEANGSAAVGETTSEGRRFRVLRRHATGGLGMVSVAIDTELGREVALKELKGDHADRPESRARFVQEAEITGGLEHPCIVPVYGLGQYEDGRPFYAMRFIKGDSLKEAIEAFHKQDVAPDRLSGERTIELRRLLGRFLDVCHAVHYAHRRGVLHRDLKPSNVMLGEFGESLVVDWGLAKSIGDGNRKIDPSDSVEIAMPLSSGSGSAETQFGSVLGTPAYMSPEQAAGATDELGVATDVYSLGATLYCLLTGRPPFVFEESSGMTAVELLSSVREGRFPGPREIKPGIAKPLEAICRKAMSRLPEDRYRTVQDLADDVERHLADELVGAYTEPWTERLTRWTRRNRTLVRAAALSLVLITTVAVVSAVMIDKQRQKAESAVIEEAVARNAESIARQEAEIKRIEAVDAHKKEVAAREEEALARRKAEKVVEYMVDALRSPDPSRGGQSITVAEVLEQAMKKTETHLADEPLIRAELLNAIGKSYQGLGLPEQAVGALGTARDILSDVLGDEHPETRSAVNSLAAAYPAMSQVANVWPIAKAAFKQAQDEMADGPNFSFSSGYEFGRQLGMAGVCRRLEWRLDVVRTAHGSDAAETCQAAKRLAKVYIRAGKPEKAVALGNEYGIESYVADLLSQRANSAGLPPAPE